MKILSYLNVSNISNFEADSGYVFQRSILEELYKCWHQVLLIGPHSMPNLGTEIEVVETELSHSKYGVRFGLNWEEIKNKLGPIVDDVDVILANQSELAVQLSILMYELTGRKVPCVTYYHYLAVQGMKDGEVIFDPSLDAFGVARFIWQRQIESALFSERVIIGSNFGKNLFLQASGCSELIEKKISVIPPPVQNFEFEKTDCKNSVPVVLYNHRLYDHYGNRELFELLCELRKEFEFKLLVTDPTKKRSIIREKLDGSTKSIKSYLKSLDFVRMCHFETQYEYYQAIQNIDIGLGPFRNGALWNMAIADVMSAGKPVIAPNKAAFPEITGDKDLLFDNKEDFTRIFIKLLCDVDYRKAKGEKLKERSKGLSAEVIGEEFEKVLKEVVEETRNDAKN